MYGYILSLGLFSASLSTDPLLASILSRVRRDNKQNRNCGNLKALERKGLIVRKDKYIILFFS